MSKTTILASGQISPTDTIFVEPREPDEFPTSVFITGLKQRQWSIRGGSVQLRTRSRASLLRPSQRWRRIEHMGLSLGTAGQQTGSAASCIAAD